MTSDTAVPLRRAEQKIGHRGAGLVVEIRRRLVGEQELRPIDQRAGDGHPLLLADRQLMRIGIDAIVDAQRLQHGVRRRTIHRQPGDALRDQQVLQRGQRRQQVELLQDDADVPPAEAVARGRGERRQILSVDDDRAAGGQQQSGDQVQQRRLPAAGRSDDEDVALRFQDELIEPQHVVAAVVAEAELLEANHRAARAPSLAAVRAAPVERHVVMLDP